MFTTESSIVATTGASQQLFGGSDTTPVDPDRRIVHIVHTGGGAILIRSNQAATTSQYNHVLRPRRSVFWPCRANETIHVIAADSSNPGTFRATQVRGV